MSVPIPEDTCEVYREVGNDSMMRRGGPGQRQSLQKSETVLVEQEFSASCFLIHWNTENIPLCLEREMFSCFLLTTWKSWWKQKHSTNPQ